jgi:hypothetical protein
MMMAKVGDDVNAEQRCRFVTIFALAAEVRTYGARRDRDI